MNDKSFKNVQSLNLIGKTFNLHYIFRPLLPKRHIATFMNSNNATCNIKNTFQPFLSSDNKTSLRKTVLPLKNICRFVSVYMCVSVCARENECVRVCVWEDLVQN